MADRSREITLRLEHPQDLFQLPQTDLFTEYRNYLTGVELAISELRSRDIRHGLELRVLLPPDQISDGLDVRMMRALKRYCEERIRYNDREKRATRLDGTTSFWIGIPITALGMLITIYTAQREATGDALEAMLDHLGWIFAWIGLWFPLDTILFTPHAYSRENRALRALRDANVTIEPADKPPPVTSLDA